MLSSCGFCDQIDLFVSVPIHHTRKRDRGFNQSDIIAETIAKKTGNKVTINSVKRQKATITQTKLNVNERKNNVNDAFKVVHPEVFFKKNVAIIDDVVTSGSTILSLANELKKNGANIVTAIALTHPTLDEYNKSQYKGES
jgi:ComF family protein